MREREREGGEMLCHCAPVFLNSEHNDTIQYSAIQFSNCNRLNNQIFQQTMSADSAVKISCSLVVFVILAT